MFLVREREKIGYHIADKKALPELFGNPILTCQALVCYTYAEDIKNSKYLQLKSCLNYCISLNLKQSNLTIFFSSFQTTEKLGKPKPVTDNSRAATVLSPWLLRACFPPTKALLIF